MIAEPVPNLLPRRMTEAEFEALRDQEARAEFVDGEVIPMAAVSLIHLRVTRFLNSLLERYLEEHSTGELLGPEFEVRHRAGLRRVPDLLYLAHENGQRLTGQRVEGPPDCAWEVVSPDSIERDWREKYLEYEAAGVREYWVIAPGDRIARLYRLVEGRYVTVPERDGRLESEVIHGFWLMTEWLCQDPLPNVRDCLRELGAV